MKKLLLFILCLLILLISCSKKNPMEPEPDPTPTPAPSGPTPTPNPSIPAAPASLSLLGNGPYSINTSWVDNSTNETGFKLYANNVNNKSTATLKETTASNVTNQLISGLYASTFYYIWVESFNVHGTSSSISSSTTTSNLNFPSAYNGTWISNHIELDTFFGLGWTTNYTKIIFNNDAMKYINAFTCESNALVNFSNEYYYINITNLNSNESIIKATNAYKDGVNVYSSMGDKIYIKVFYSNYGVGPEILDITAFFTIFSPGDNHTNTVNNALSQDAQMMTLSAEK